MDALIIYPHQLFLKHPTLIEGRIVYLVEEPLFLIHNPAHVQRLLLHRLSMQKYKDYLENEGFTVRYIEISSVKTSNDVFQKIHADGVRSIHTVDTTDDFLEKEITAAVSAYNLVHHRYDSPLFILPKEEAIHRYKNSGRFMAKFYKQIRIDKNILMDGDTPVGGAFSFDSENRQKLPKDIALPEDISFIDENDDITAAKKWLETFSSERYGEARVWVPYSHKAAQEFLKEFLRRRFTNFGPYEDAMTKEHTRLFHSTLSPLMNIGLLTAQEVIDTTLAYAEENQIPINSLEGFVRQILGWREFIRAAYEVDGNTMRTTNFFKHKKPLPFGIWNGTTGVAPLDLTVSRALTYGYTHHIERLMVAGNLFLLTGTNPDEAYRWFMGMYVDAYDWVMVPNVYGMSQFADGGIFATKPYISGASYINKMSDYKNGSWEKLWTALYWNFIDTHKEFFIKNHRLSMMPKLLDKMSLETRNAHLDYAREYLKEL